jgi:hypothetical protein
LLNYTYHHIIYIHLSKYLDNVHFEVTFDDVVRTNKKNKRKMF